MDKCLGYEDAWSCWSMGSESLVCYVVSERACLRTIRLLEE